MPSDAELLSIQYQTLFRTTAAGRIERENDPDRSIGPRFWLAGCASGNVAGVRADVGHAAAAEVMELAASEPPFTSPGGQPRHLNRYKTILSDDSPAPREAFGLTFELPRGLTFGHSAVLIDSDSAEGERLLASFSASGLPAGLVELGFRDVSDLWPPWCVALHEGEVRSVAFAARISEAGAELGIATVANLRGRGYAAAATAGWSRLPSLRSHALFYSTDPTNRSSQRVTARLGLRFVGSSLRLL